MRLPRGNFIAHIHDYSAYSDMDNDTIHCVGLTPRDISIIIAALEPLYWITRWTNMGTTNIENEIAAIEARLQDECAMVFELRQNGCVLEQSVDGGASWSPAFDYSKCVAGPSIGDVLNFEVNFQQIINNYDGTVGSVTDNVQDVEWLDNAICYTVGAYIDTAMDALISQRDDAQSETLIQAIASGAIITGFYILGGLPGGMLGLAIGGAIFALNYDDIVDIPGGVFEDESLRHELKCCMVDTLTSVAVPSQSIWENALDNCTMTGFNADVRDLIAQTLTEETFIAWLQALDVAMPFSQAGKVDDCDCIEEPQTWSYFWDFTTAERWSLDGDYHGIWQSGYGWWSETTANYELYWIQTQIPSTANITSVRINHSTATNQQSAKIHLWLRDAGNNDVYYAGPSITGGPNKSTILTSPSGWTGVSKIMSAYTASNDGKGNGRISGISIEGTGTPPAFTGGEFA